MKRIFFSVLIALVLTSITVLVIAYGRGYRLDFAKGRLAPTGLLVTTSNPDGAQVFIDGTLRTATNTTLSLPPGWYQVRLIKEGYLSWEKRLRIQGEVVAKTEAWLFPSTPTLTPLTITGVIAPTLSPDGTKLAYATTSPPAKAGLWLQDLTSPFLGFPREPRLISRTTASLDFASATFSWSADSKQILVRVGERQFLVETERNGEPTLLSLTDLATLKKDWQEEAKEKEAEKLTPFPTEFVRLATQSAKILAFSPDETKILYQATEAASLPLILAPPPIASNPTPETRNLKPKATYVYDTKEDKNFEIGKNEASLSWFPSSRHLVEVTSDKISILEYDGSNKTTLYSGPFEKFVASLPSGARLLILTSYNRPVGPPPGGLPNLYYINLR